MLSRMEPAGCCFSDRCFWGWFFSLIPRRGQFVCRHPLPVHLFTDRAAAFRTPSPPQPRAVARRPLPPGRQGAPRARSAGRGGAAMSDSACRRRPPPGPRWPRFPACAPGSGRCKSFALKQEGAEQKGALWPSGCGRRRGRGGAGRWAGWARQPPRAQGYGAKGAALCYTAVRGLSLLLLGVAAGWCACEGEQGGKPACSVD